MSDLLVALTQTLLDALEPIDIAFENEANFERLLWRLGWASKIDPAAMGSIRAAFRLRDLYVTAQTIAARFRDGTSDELEVASDLLDALIDIVEQIRALNSAPAGGLPAPLDRPEFWTGFSRDLLDYLILTYLERRQPVVFGALLLFGLADLIETTPGSPDRIGYTRYVLYWDRIGGLVTQPIDHFRSVYHSTFAP